MHRTPLVLILLSSIACGSTGSPTNPAPSTQQANRAPVIASMTVSAGFAVAQLTTVSYAASATDADGDSLAYMWDFGDGTSATGAEVVHTYGNVSGERSTRLTVSDGRGGSASDTRPVTVGNLGGSWEGTTGPLGGPFWTMSLSLSQGVNGAATGTCVATGPSAVERFGGNLDPAAQNRIDGDGRVVLRCKSYRNVDDFRIEGVMGHDTGNQILGEVSGPGFNGEVIVFTRVFR
jgi:hypothetical protein